MEVTVYASDVRDLHDEIMQRLNVRFEYGDEPFANSPAKKDEEHICAILRADDVGTWHFEEGTMLDIMQGQQLQINELNEHIIEMNKTVSELYSREQKQQAFIQNLQEGMIKVLEQLTNKGDK